jgi:hypothetical protein
MEKDPTVQDMLELMLAQMRDLMVTNDRLRAENAQMLQLLCLFMNDAWSFDVWAAKEQARALLTDCPPLNTVLGVPIHAGPLYLPKG